MASKMNPTYQSSDFFKYAPRQPTYHQIMDMVKIVENELEKELCEKRNQLKIQLSNEEQMYYREINEKYKMQREFEIDEQRKDLERLRMERELDRQKYTKMKQLQQQIQNSEELRLKLSQKLLAECAESRNQRIQEKLHENALTRAAEKAIIEEKRLLQQQELQKEYEAEKFRQQKQREARQELDRQVTIKRERELIRKQQEEIELKFLQQTDETVKKSNENIEKTKQCEIKRQKEFLRYQIEQRKKFKEFQRQQEIELAKIEMEQIKQDEKLLAETNIQAKRAKNIEILQFNDYMTRVRSDQEKIQMDLTDWTQVKRANDRIELKAEMERQKKRQLLNAEQRNEYLQKLNEKRAERMHEKEIEFYNFQQTQKQNAMYEEMVAEKQQQHRSQFINDLDQQIKLKNMERARNVELEIEHNHKIDEINCTTNALNQKLLLNDDDIEKLLPEHPFYHNLKSRSK